MLPSRRSRPLSIEDTWSGQRHTIALAVALSLVLIVVGVLAWHTWVSNRAHRRATEHALREYAAFAVASYADRLRSSMYFAFSPILSVAERRRGDARTIARAMRRVADSLAECECAPIASPRYVFHSAAGTATAVEPNDPGTRALAEVHGDAMRAHIRAEKHDLRVSDVTALPHIDLLGDRWLHVYLLPNARGEITGLALPQALAVDLIFGGSWRSGNHLPPALGRNRAQDSLLSIRIVASDGGSIFQSRAQYPPRHVATQRVLFSGAAFDVTIALNPDSLAAFVPGGVPPSPAPVLTTLLGIAALLVAIAFLLTWRFGELARLRSDFTSSVSHELRTPLTQILLYAEMIALARTRSEQDTTRAIGVVVREGRRLAHLVENVLQFARAERRIFQVAPRATRLRPALEEIVTSFVPIAASHGVDVVLEVDADLAAMSDTDALRHVMLNLLDNAVRYGGGPQTVRIGAERRLEWVCVWVDDQGPGIPARERARVWQPFVRLEAAGSAATGSGIGLSVVRELVTALGGQCSIDDAPGGGARLVISLPQASA